MIAVRSKALVLCAIASFSVLSMAACDDDATSNPAVDADAGSTNDAGSTKDASDGVDANDGIDAADPSDGGADAATESDAAGNGGCDDACRKTSLDAFVNKLHRELGHAHFGHESADAGGGLYVEVVQGGDGACPTETSPTPDRMLVLKAFPDGSPGQIATEAGATTATFLDFVGDQLTEAVFVKAKSFKVTIAAKDFQASPAWLAIDVEATFDEGTVTGHAFAEHCDSLDE